MPANLRPYFLKGGNYFSLEESFRNLVGTPIISVTKAPSNRQRSGIYTLTFNTVVPGVSAICMIATADPHDPSRNVGGESVLLDGTTQQVSIVEGLSIVLSAAGAFNSTWSAVIYYGVFFDTTDSTENSILRFGTIVAGADSAEKRIAVRNDGSDLAASCQAIAVNAITQEDVSGNPIKSVGYTETSAVTNFNPGYLVTFSNRLAGTPVHIDVRVDAATYDLIRLDTGVVFPGGAAVPADGLTQLQWTSGPLTGIIIVLNTSVANTDQTRFRVSDASNQIKIAPDLAGAAGTYQSGTVPLQLTEDGGAIPGEIRAGMVGFFWMKVHTLGTDSPANNQRVGRLVLRGLGV